MASSTTHDDTHFDSLGGNAQTLDPILSSEPAFQPQYSTFPTHEYHLDTNESTQMPQIDFQPRHSAFQYHWDTDELTRTSGDSQLPPTEPNEILQAPPFIVPSLGGDTQTSDLILSSDSSQIDSQLQHSAFPVYDYHNELTRTPGGNLVPFTEPSSQIGSQPQHSAFPIYDYHDELTQTPGGNLIPFTEPNEILPAPPFIVPSETHLVPQHFIGLSGSHVAPQHHASPPQFLQAIPGMPAALVSSPPSTLALPAPATSKTPMTQVEMHNPHAPGNFFPTPSASQVSPGPSGVSLAFPAPPTPQTLGPSASRTGVACRQRSQTARTDPLQTAGHHAHDTMDNAVTPDPAAEDVVKTAVEQVINHARFELMNHLVTCEAVLVSNRDSVITDAIAGAVKSDGVTFTNVSQLPLKVQKDVSRLINEVLRTWKAHAIPLVLSLLWPPIKRRPIDLVAQNVTTRAATLLWDFSYLRQSADDEYFTSHFFVYMIAYRVFECSPRMWVHIDRQAPQNSLDNLFALGATAIAANLQEYQATGRLQRHDVATQLWQSNYHRAQNLISQMRSNPTRQVALDTAQESVMLIGSQLVDEV